MSKVKVISGKGKISFNKEADKAKMEKKYPDVEFEKMNKLKFTTKYKGNKEYDLKIKVGDTEISCSYKQFAWPWKSGSKLSLEPHFKDLKKKILNSNQPEKIEPKVLEEKDNSFEYEEARYMLNLIAKTDFKGQDVQVVYNIALKLQTLIKETTI